MDEGDICDSNLSHALKGKANLESASRSVPKAENGEKMGKCRNQLRWGGGSGGGQRSRKGDCQYQGHGMGTVWGQALKLAQRRKVRRTEGLEPGV